MLGGAHPTIVPALALPVLLPLGGEQFEFAEAEPDAGSAADCIVGRRRTPRMVHRATCLYKKDARSRAQRGWRRGSRSSIALLENKYYVDEFYNFVFVGGTLAFSRALSWFDANIIDGIVNGVRHLTVVAARPRLVALRPVHRRWRRQRRRLHARAAARVSSARCRADSSRTMRW